MTALLKLWSAIANLAANLSALADTIGEANGRLRHNLLDAPVVVEALAGPEVEAEPTGRRARAK
jgi:hypothetical protein